MNTRPLLFDLKFSIRLLFNGDNVHDVSLDSKSILGSIIEYIISPMNTHD